jgi:hypothetical protein
MKDKQAFPVGSLAHISPIYREATIPIYDRIPGSSASFSKDIGEFTPSHICLIVSNGPDGYSIWRKVLMGGTIGWISTLDLVVLHEAR